jgi:hypothetical protein
VPPGGREADDEPEGIAGECRDDVGSSGSGPPPGRGRLLVAHGHERGAEEHRGEQAMQQERLGRQETQRSEHQGE